MNLKSVPRMMPFGIKTGDHGPVVHFGAKSKTKLNLAQTSPGFYVSAA